jgi:hypothetical protein
MASPQDGVEDAADDDDEEQDAPARGRGGSDGARSPRGNAIKRSKGPRGAGGAGLIIWMSVGN